MKAAMAVILHDLLSVDWLHVQVYGYIYVY